MENRKELNIEELERIIGGTESETSAERICSAAMHSFDIVEGTAAVSGCGSEGGCSLFRLLMKQCDEIVAWGSRLVHQN